MKLKDAVRVLMDAAARDCVGQSCGIRANNDARREWVSEAWSVAFKWVNRYEPRPADFFNVGLSVPCDRFTGKDA